MNQSALGTEDVLSQWVTFRLGDESYGVDVMQVREVLRFTEIAPVPGAPEFVLGIINLRGNVVTVVDARTRLGMPTREPDDASRIIVVESGEQVMGILVDSVAEVAYLYASQMESAPNVGNEESSRFIQGVSNRDKDLLILMDLNKLLSVEEWQQLAVVNT